MYVAKRLKQRRKRIGNWSVILEYGFGRTYQGTY